jgi:YD repeat-containing protein
MSAGDLSVGRAGGVGRPAPSAARSPRHPHTMSTSPERSPGLICARPPLRQDRKVRNTKTRKHQPALGAGLPTPPKCLTDRSPSFRASLASTNTSETWVCDERGRPVGRTSRRGQETRAERHAGGVGRPAPSAARSPRDPHGDAYFHIRASDRRMPARGHEPAQPLSTASLTVWHRVVPLPGLSNLAPRP